MAYFSNLVLLATFGGMGLGVALGRRTTRLFPWLFPWLLVITLAFTFSSQLSLMHMKFLDATVSLWGGRTKYGNMGIYTVNPGGSGIVFGGAGVFRCAGIPAGYFFNQLSPLTAYSPDLVGSMVGVLATTLAAAWGTLR